MTAGDGMTVARRANVVRTVNFSMRTCLLESFFSQVRQPTKGRTPRVSNNLRSEDLRSQVLISLSVLFLVR
jgi:hypothetical protein